MNWTEAAAFVMPFGKYKGKKVDVVAKDDDGLRYLDWLRGELWMYEQTDVKRDVAEALDVYLDDPVIRRELEEIL